MDTIMPDFVRVLLDTSDVTARWQLNNWTALHGWTHVIADLAICGAYTAIPILIAVLISRRHELGFPRVLWLFVAFIFASSFTYLLDALTYWYPVYRLEAVAKVVTAALSWTTLLVLIGFGPQILRLPSITEVNLKLEREVAQRRNAERKLVENANVLQVALAAGEIGTWRWDLHTAGDRRDAGLNGILGLPPRATTQPMQDFFKRVHPDDRAAVERAVEAAREGDGEYTAEFRIVRPDGSIRWVRDRGRVICDVSHEPILMTGAIVDVTEAHLAEEGRARLAAIVETSPDAIISQSLDGTVLSWNAGAEQTFGFTAEEVIGRPIELVVPEEQRQELAEYRAAARRGEVTPHLETVRRRKDGALIDVWLAVSPIRDRRGNVIALSAVERDITERKRHAEMLQRLNQDLRARNEEMEQFAYIVSHDLKSPVITMMGFAELLREDLGDNVPADAIDGLNRIESAAKRMGRLIDDLLELSRVGRVKQETRPVDVGALVEELRLEYEEQLTQAGATLLVEPTLIPVQADPLRLKQVLQNLLVNAIKYGCTAQRPEIRVGVRKNRSAETCLFVRDNGAGIAPEYHERIFRLFEQGGPGQEGTGVGLALVTKIAQAHGGRAWVESSPGNGATFWVSFRNEQSKI